MKIIKKLDSGEIFPYIAWVPEGAGARPGLIIHLHGAGERGCGGEELDSILINGLPQVANDENLKDCILLMPQCPPDSFWAARVESIKRFIDAAVEKFAADEKRIYLCGLSMGGYGTWYTAMAYPDMFAAIAPCCGGGMAWNAEVLTMPIWTFHGLEDSVVDARNTVEMVDALKGINPRLRYDLYEGVDHDSWVRAFSPALLEWFHSNKK